MLTTRVMPCLLVDDGRLVKTVRFKKPAYIGDPINAIKIYNEKEVDELILLDITATRQNRRPPFGLIEKVASECFMPLTYGGGVRLLDDMKTIFSLGVEKIALNSQAAENPGFVRQAADRFGSQSLVVSIDVKKDFWGRVRIWTHGGTKIVRREPAAYAGDMEACGAGEFLVNSISRDGTMTGYDLELLRQVTAAVSIPVIALGGAGSVDDIVAAVTDGGAAAAAAGSLFVYQGKDMGVLINFPPRIELEARLT